MRPGVPMSTILPATVREALVLASRVESRIEMGESATRAMAVNAVVEAARNNHPTYFQEEK